MDKTEVRLIAVELYEDYGKMGALDACFESIRSSVDDEILFWEAVIKYIENNFDDDLNFGTGQY